MATADVLILRVITDELNSEKIILPPRPETVNDLILRVKEMVNLPMTSVSSLRTQNLITH